MKAVLSRSSSSNLSQQKTVPTPLFEIRLQNLEHDVVVVKGPPDEAGSVLLSGNVVLAINEPIHVKKVSLKLFGDLRLNWIEHLESGTTSYSKPSRYIKRIFEHNWDNFSIQSYATEETIPSPPSGLNSTNNSSSPSAHQNNDHKLGFHLKRSSKSSTSLLGMNRPALNTSHSTTSLNRSGNMPNPDGYTLPKGNYQFPFSVILPGSINESVEGLPGGSLVYKIAATIERGKFSKKLMCSKHFRIIRTMTPDAPELSETMSIDNSWTNKIEYTISIPSRAMAIGSGCPINFLMVPLLKGLKLGKITIKLIEYYSFAGNSGKYVHSNKRTVSQMIIPKPSDDIYEKEEPTHIPDDTNIMFNPINNFMKLSYDRWEVEKCIQIPPSLSKCTQDVTINKNLKVRHKLSIVVALKNPNGHTSELRATLPVILYISPFVSVSARYDDQLYLYSFSDSIPELSNEHNLNLSKNSSSKKKINSNPTSNSSSTNDLNGLNKELNNVDDNDDNEILFDSAETGQLVDASTGRPDLVAPPNYGEHIYDQLWSDIETPNTPTAMTPIGSVSPIGTLTPGIRTPPLSNNNLNNTAAQRIQFNTQLNSRLRSLAEQAEDNNTIEGITESNSSLATNNNNNNNNIEPAEQDYFSLPTNLRNSVVTPMSPNVFYISRTNSSNHLHGLSSNLQSPSETPSWNNNTLSRVPSYETATKSNIDTSLLSPAYNVSTESVNNVTEFAKAIDNNNTNSNSNSNSTNNSPINFQIPKKSKKLVSQPDRPVAKRNSSFLHLRFGSGNLSKSSSTAALHNLTSAFHHNQDHENKDENDDSDDSGDEGIHM